MIETTSTPPFFLVGAERSGTTMLRLMLDHHPEIACESEFEYAVDCVADDGQYPDLKEYYGWLGLNRIFTSSGFTIDDSLDYPGLMQSFLDQRRGGKTLIGATVHRHFNRLLHIWPEAKFIHLYRDGRDVARSTINMGWAGNTWTGVSNWIEAETLWDELKPTLPESQYVEVKYEELIAHPESELSRISRFIGVDYQPAMLDYPNETNYEAPDPSLCYQWRNKMSDVEIQLIESRVHGLLLARGYELSGLPILEISPVDARRLRMQDRAARLRFRIKRYGAAVVVAETLARRLHIRPVEHAMRRRMNEMDAKVLR